MIVFRPVLRVRGDLAVDDTDDVAVEEPLELQLAPADGPFRSVAVLMRTPPHREHDDDSDLELATGFLFTERVIRAVDDIAAMDTAGVVPDPAAEDNVLQVRLKEGIDVDWRRLTRHVFSASSCGVCGKATIDAVLSPGRARDADLPKSEVVVDAAILRGLQGRLRDHQPLFSRTGGTHAALLASAAGEDIVVREDVGRHNALDKVLGHALRARRDLRDAVVVVSGRVAFELVQKCVRAGVGVIAGRGAPSSLAIDLGERAGVAVVGFVHDEGCNVYSARARVRVRP